MLRTGSVAIVFFALGLTSSTVSQETVHPDRFPYAFSNFAWWTDADLRAQLKHRIPGLGDEIARNSAMETRIRGALVALLKTKGVQATVQVHEPDADYASHQRVPEAPPVSIVFSIGSPPYIAIDKITLNGAPSDLTNALQSAIETRSMYSSQNFWWMENNLKGPLTEAGYLTATVTIRAGTPLNDDSNYKIPLTALISPGPKYHVASIKGSGGPLLAGRDLSSYFTLKPGDVAKLNPFGRLIGSIRSTYWRAGYLDIKMRGEPTLDTEHALASYDLQVIPGPQYRLRSLRILHLDESQQATVKTIVNMKPGDIYDGMATPQLAEILRSASSPLQGYNFTYSPKEDVPAHAVDLTLDFYKLQ